MNSDDIELLRRYAFERSEEAFADLVQRHIGLVYSAALRQTQGDATLAQDVTQVVFTGLARTATRLTRHTSLAGWLYTTTRHTAATLRRGEQRRCTRELEAHAMNELLQSAETNPAWAQLRPVLDEAMHDLKATDREAVLLRFFESLPLATVGARLGVTENTARMRVARALERLRTALVKRGVTSTAGALAAVLGVQAVGAAPAGLAATGSSVAVAGAGAASALSVLAAKALASVKLKLIAGAAAGVAIVALWVWHWDGASRRAPAASRLVGPPAAAVSAPSAAASSHEGPGPAGPVGGADTNTLRLTILAADANKPVPGVEVECIESRKGGIAFPHRKFISLRNGVCDVHYRSGYSRIRLVAWTDGFADTAVQWDRTEGDTIPASYTLRLIRAVHIGGYVRDEEGLPVADAKVVFEQNGAEVALGQAAPTGHEDHAFYHMQAVTDGQGRWNCDRIAPELLWVTKATASHPERPSEKATFDTLEAQRLLREGAFVFKLSRGVTVRGTVHDEQGNAVAKADVDVQSHPNEGPWPKTMADGSFVVKRCRAGENYITISAEGFASKRMNLNLEADLPPLNVVLERGGTLRLRVVNGAGQPVSGAEIHTWQVPTGSPATMGTPGTGFTDAEGRAAVPVAAAGPLEAMIQPAGYVWARVKLTADSEEHSITLDRIPVISGTVTEADSGQLVTAFRVAFSWSFTSDSRVTNQGAGALDDWHKFSDGKYRLEENRSAMSAGLAEYRKPGEPVKLGFLLRFEADGYAPFVSRVIHTGEPDVRLDVALPRAQPIQSIQVTVLNPDGVRAAETDVCLLRRGEPTPDIWQGRITSRLAQDLLRTDSRGVFSLPLDGSVTGVIALNSHGFAEVSASDLSREPTVRLQSFGQLEGRWLAGNQPAEGRRLLLLLTLADGHWVRLDRERGITPDAEGRFVVPQLPPGKYELHSISKDPSGRDHYTKFRTNAEVRPGETATVTVETP